LTTTRRDLLVYSSLAAVLVAALVVLFFAGPRWLSTPPEPNEAASAAPAEVRKIRANLYFVEADGERLSTVEREVLYAESPAEQARRIVEAELAPPPAPYISPIPPGTTVKTVFLTPKGEAYIDLSPEVRTNHPGGTTNELLTVYALVNTLTSNLPAISGVQILVDGKEIDTLAGHLDLRRPLEQNLAYATRQPGP
jgi:hypothetical protein